MSAIDDLLDDDDDEANDTNLGPTRKGREFDPEALAGPGVEYTEAEADLLRKKVVVASQIGGPKIPDSVDISDAPVADSIARDEEFYVGNFYKPGGLKSHTGAKFEIVEHETEPQHVAFEESMALMAKLRGVDPPLPSFYVKTPRGAVGWVPWVGSSVVWPWESGWNADLVDDEDGQDLKPGQPKGKK